MTTRRQLLAGGAGLLGAALLPGAIARSHADHAEIVRALEGRDREATVRAFDVHIQRIYETTLRVMGLPPVAATGEKSRLTG